MKWITKLLNKNVPYVADDGCTYSATVAEHLQIAIIFVAALAAVLFPLLLVCPK